MASCFVEQGDAMITTQVNFRIPAASMSSFDILSVAPAIFLKHGVLDPLRFKKSKGDHTELIQLQRMCIGLVTTAMAMLSVGIVEHYRLPYAINDCKYSEGSSSVKLSLLFLNLLTSGQELCVWEI